jgi:hypothetical protein
VLERKTLSRISKWAVAVSVSGLILVLAVGCQSKQNNSARAQAAADSSCGFHFGQIRGALCRTSIYALVVDPMGSSGKRVFTHGYLDVGSSGNYVLGVSPAAFEADDLISCIRIESIDRQGKPAGSSLDREGLYAVTVVGLFTANEAGDDRACVGSIAQASLVSARRVGD